MPLKTHQDTLPELNLTSMIDVVFLLIIFFMAGTKFAEMERSVKLDVPRVNQLGALQPSPTEHVVNVYRDGSVLLDKHEITLADLTERLRAEAGRNPSLGVIVRGDAEGAYQHVARVLSACSTAGVRDLQISVQLDRTRR
jgi:biopolymer transport protein ExbD